MSASISVYVSIDCGHRSTGVNITDNSLIAVMAKNTNFVGARLSEEMKAAFDKYVSGSGKKPTEVIREAIGSYLNFRESKITVDIDWKTEIERRLKTLEGQIQVSKADEELAVQAPLLDFSGSDDTSDREAESSNKLLTTKDVAALEECRLKYSGLVYRHKKGRSVTLANGTILEPTRIKAGPRWQKQKE